MPGSGVTWIKWRQPAKDSCCVISQSQKIPVWPTRTSEFYSPIITPLWRGLKVEEGRPPALPSGCSFLAFFSGGASRSWVTMISSVVPSPMPSRLSTGWYIVNTWRWDCCWSSSSVTVCCDTVRTTKPIDTQRKIHLFFLLNYITITVLEILLLF